MALRRARSGGPASLYQHLPHPQHSYFCRSTLEVTEVYQLSYDFKIFPNHFEGSHSIFKEEETGSVRLGDGPKVPQMVGCRKWLGTLI